MWIEVYDHSHDWDAQQSFTNLNFVVSVRVVGGQCRLYGQNNVFLGKAVRPDEVLQALQTNSRAAAR